MGKSGIVGEAKINSYKFSDAELMTIVLSRLQLSSGSVLAAVCKSRFLVMLEIEQKTIIYRIRRVLSQKFEKIEHMAFLKK